MKSVFSNSGQKVQRYLTLAGITVTFAITLTLAGFVYFPRQPAHAAPGDWTTFLGSNARTGYDASETIINPTTAPNLKLRWTALAGGRVSGEPIMANGVLYWGSWDGVLHATNPSTGQDTWKTTLSTKQGSCGQQVFGVVGAATVATVPINGTPTSVVFVAGGQDNVYALNASSGQIIWQTNLGNNPAELIYDSTAVYNGSVYIGISSSGDCPLVQGQIVQLNASTGAIQNTFNVVPTGCIGAGVWGSPTIDVSTGMLYFGTGNADPLHCLTTEPLGSSIVELRASDLSLVASWQFTPNGTTDADVGSTPTLFNATIGGVSDQMVGLESKDGNYYAFDRTKISAGPLWHISISVAGRSPELGLGSISSSAYDGTNLYVAGGNTTINGTSCQGSLDAVNPGTGAFLWKDCLNNPALDPVIAVPGLAIVGAGNTIHVVASGTGKLLYSYQDTASNAKFWGAAMISNGVLYMGCRNGTMLALWTAAAPSSPTPSLSPTLTVSPTISPTASPTSSPTTPPPLMGPVSSKWYFAEGNVGNGFTEYLTLENPDRINACTVDIQYLLSSGNNPPAFTVTIPVNSRYTESVNKDLNLPANHAATSSVSTVITIDSSTPNCQGVVAERPMYFTNFFGVSSGDDVVGATATSLGKSFYFADVSTLSTYNSFISILNPSTTSAANVTATYYAAGQQIGSQTLTVQPNTRGTITPTRFGKRVATIVTSDQPVMVERPSYFSNYSAGNAGTVSGAGSVIGATAANSDWRFAEGYVGTGFQEDLVLANFDPTIDIPNGTLLLEYDTGATYSFPISISHQSQTIYDINQLTANPATFGGACLSTSQTCNPSLNVSMEVTTPTGSPGIVAEREMYFHYNNNHGLAVSGGTDITGQSGTASHSSYSFAEGYTNTGFNEWLTLQNPTTAPETIWVTLFNQLGHSYTTSYSVKAQSRSTVDITGLVSLNLLPSGGGIPGNEVSMTVQTTQSGAFFVAERPEYFSAFGTEGGSDVIGYYGQ